MASGARRVFLSHTSELSRYPTRRTFTAAAAAAVADAADAYVEMQHFRADDDPPARI
jgi:hypothetical protein